MPEKLGKALRMIREAKGLTLRVLAERAGISTPYLGLIEVGERSPSIRTIRALSDALDVPVDFFFLIATDREPEPKSPETTAQRLLRIYQRMERLERELHDAVEKRSGTEPPTRSDRGLVG